MYTGTDTDLTLRFNILGLERSQHRKVVYMDWFGPHIEKLYTDTGMEPTSRSCIPRLVLTPNEKLYTGTDMDHTSRS